jgi:hypothetical protein
MSMTKRKNASSMVPGPQPAGISTTVGNQRLQNGVNGIVLIGNPVFNGATKWQQVKSRGVIGRVNAYYLREQS